MISLISASLFYFICSFSVNEVEAEHKNLLNHFISRILFSFALAISTLSIISLFFIFLNIAKVNISILSSIFFIALICLKYKKLYKIKFYFLNVFKEFLIFSNDFNKLDYLIIFIIFALYILSIGPINHSDASTAYVGYIKQFWVRNSHFVDGSVHQGLIGITDFINLPFFQDGNTWLIRSIQVLPLFPSVIYLLKNNINKLILLSFLCSPNFIQWVTIGKNLFFYDLIIAILYIVWNSNKSNRNLVCLISMIMINIASKITGVLIIVPIIFHLIFHYRSKFFNFQSILESKFSLTSLVIGFLTISISFYYRYYVTGNPVYPLFADFFTPNNQLFIDFELDIRNYMRGLLFPLKMIIPFGIKNIGIVLGPALGFSLLLSFLNISKLNKIKLRPEFIVGLAQLLLLLLFCQGRANYYTCPLIVIFSTIDLPANKIFLVFKNIKLNIFCKNFFFINLFIQIIMFSILIFASCYQTFYASIDYDNAMRNYAYNYDLSKIINQKINEPYLNLVTIQDRLFTDRNYVDAYSFNECLINNKIKKQNELEFCLSKYKVQSAILNKDGKYIIGGKQYLFFSNASECTNFDAFIGSRNIFSSYRKEILVCNLNKKVLF